MSISLKYGNTLALSEFLLDGNKITRIESLLYFGVQNLTAVLSNLKKDGYLIKKKKVTMAKILRRVNEKIKCEHPKNLPIRDIIMHEWWISNE